MKNKVVFRILGALASALIIVSVFVPFMSLNGYTQNLWNSYQVTNALYLPIMIMVFGLIGVIFFSLNVKTEFAYMTSGATTFYAVMQTILYLDSFSTLSIGYYFLVIGALLTGIMAFICNLKVKVIVQEEVKEEVKDQPSMLDQIDKLYNDQTSMDQNQLVQPFDNGMPVQPLGDTLVQPFDSGMPVQPLGDSLVQPLQEVPTPIETPMTMPEQPAMNNVQTISAVPPAVPEVPVMPSMEASATSISSVASAPQQPTNPALQDFASVQPVEQAPQQPINPALQDFASVQPVEQAPQQPVNPALQDFAPVQPVEQASQQPTNPALQDFAPVQPVEQAPQNPVTQEFMNPTVAPSPAEVASESLPISEVEISPLSPMDANGTGQSVNPVIEGFTNPNSANANNNQTNSLDIFGQ